MEQYAVTGIGVYNGLGANAETSWQNLCLGKSAVQPIEWPEDNDAKFPKTHSALKINTAALSPKLTAEDSHPKLFDGGWSNWDPNTRACLMSVDEAVNDSQLTSKDVGVVVSTFGSGTSIRLDIFSALDKGIKKISPRKSLNIGLDFPAAQVSSLYKVTGPNTAMDSACTTGLTSIDHAIMTLKTNPDLDAMIVGGSDHLAEPVYMYWFQSLGALSPFGDLRMASCPFDIDRSGFTMGEGASTMIIEPLSKAKARGAKIYGIVRGTGFVTIFDSDTAPDKDGKGARQVVHKALANAGLKPQDIDLINAHATSTPVGDFIEYEAMSEIFPGKHCVSNKGQVGHTMAGAGVLETIYTLQGMREGVIAPNANLLNPIGDNLEFPKESKKHDVKYAIKNSFGFGGRNASIVLERYDG